LTIKKPKNIINSRQNEVEREKKMLNFKEKIAETIEKVINIDTNELESYIELPKDAKNGDYAFPCFRLAKSLKKAPAQIANDIKEKIEIDAKIIEKVEVVGGYLNFYSNKTILTKEVIKEIEKEKSLWKRILKFFGIIKNTN